MPRANPQQIATSRVARAPLEEQRAIAAPIAITDGEVVINQDLKAFFQPELTLNEWLALGLRAMSPSILEVNRKDGTTVHSIRFDELRALALRVPPLAEQQRIVAKVEELLSQVNSARERLARLPALLKRFRQSVLSAACDGRLTADWRDSPSANGDLPGGWDWRRLETLLPQGGIFDGPFGSNLKTDDYTSSGVRVVRLENIAQLNFIDEKGTYISKEKYAALRKHTVAQGDIIFASFVEDEVRACVLPRMRTAAIAKADCFCLRPNADVVLPEYLVLQLVSRDSHDFLLESIHGATRPRVNTTQLRQLDVRVCPHPTSRRRSSGASTRCSRSRARSSRAWPQRPRARSGSRNRSWRRRSAGSWSLPRRSWRGAKAAITSPRAYCWSGYGRSGT